MRKQATWRSYRYRHTGAAESNSMAPVPSEWRAFPVSDGRVFDQWTRKQAARRSYRYHHTGGDRGRIRRREEFMIDLHLVQSPPFQILFKLSATDKIGKNDEI